MPETANLTGTWESGELHLKNASNVDIMVLGGTTGLRAIPAGTISTATAALSLLTSMSGKVHLCTTDAVVFTLPSTALGLKYTIINTAAAAAAAIIVKTAATTDTFIGGGWASTDLPYMLTNTKGTAKPGDRVELISGSSSGLLWWVIGLVGTWTSVT